MLLPFIRAALQDIHSPMGDESSVLYNLVNLPEDGPYDGNQGPRQVWVNLKPFFRQHEWRLAKSRAIHVYLARTEHGLPLEQKRRSHGQGVRCK